jgi:Rap1a immunity proteins
MLRALSVAGGLAVLVAATSLAALLWLGQAVAGFKNGNSLHESCKALDRYSEGVCIGYVMGVADTLQTISGGCQFDRVQAGQIRDVVEKHLADHPAKRHYAADTTVMALLIENFGCKPPLHTEGEP